MRTEWLVASALLASGALTATRAQAYCQMTSVAPTQANACPTTGAPLHWEKRCMGYQFSTDGLSDFTNRSAGMGFTEASLKTLFQTAFNQWTNVSCTGGSPMLSVMIVDGHNDESTATYEKSAQNHSALIFQRRWEALGYSSAAYALTTDFHDTSSGRILDVDMEINQQDFLYYDCTSRACTNFDVDLLNVVTHEAGHAFGLGHSAAQDATMYFQSPPGETSKRDLASDDREGICHIYPSSAAALECNYDWINNKKSGCSVSYVGERAHHEAWLAGAFALLLGAVAWRRKRSS